MFGHNGHFLFCLFAILTLQSVAQERINYVFTDSVEKKLYNWLLIFPAEEQVMLMIDDDKSIGIDGMYLLSYSSDTSEDDSKVYLAKRTNRYATIGDKEIPVIFEYDYDFSTMTPKSKWGEYGKRDGTILRKRLCSRGQSCHH